MTVVSLSIAIYLLFLFAFDPYFYTDSLQLFQQIVAWKYATDDGRKELYFLNETSEVAGEFYWYSDLDENPVF